MKNQLDLFEWAEAMPTAKIIDGRPRFEAKMTRIVLDMVAGRWPPPMETPILRLHARQELQRGVAFSSNALLPANTPLSPRMAPATHWRSRSRRMRQHGGGSIGTPRSTRRSPSRIHHRFRRRANCERTRA